MIVENRPGGEAAETCSHNVKSSPTILGPKKLWFNNFVWKVLSPECWLKFDLTSKKFYRLPRKREKVGCGVEELHWHMVAHGAPVIITYRFLYYHLNEHLNYNL